MQLENTERDDLNMLFAFAKQNGLRLLLDDDSDHYQLYGEALNEQEITQLIENRRSSRIFKYRMPVKLFLITTMQISYTEDVFATLIQLVNYIEGSNTTRAEVLSLNCYEEFFGEKAFECGGILSRQGVPFQLGIPALLGLVFIKSADYLLPALF